MDQKQFESFTNFSISALLFMRTFSMQKLFSVGFSNSPNDVVSCCLHIPHCIVAYFDMKTHWSVTARAHNLYYLNAVSFFWPSSFAHFAFEQRTHAHSLTRTIYIGCCHPQANLYCTLLLMPSSSIPLFLALSSVALSVCMRG